MTVRFDRGKFELDELTELALAEYFATHKPTPVRGAGVVRLEFQEHPATTVAALEFLLHHRDGRAWLVRWPNGALKWATEDWLTERGFTAPRKPLVAEIR